jgi:hypothetical protein
LKDYVGDPLTDRLTLLGVEQGFSVLIVGNKTKLNQNGNSLKLQNSKVCALLDLSVSAEDPYTLMRIRQFLFQAN